MASATIGTIITYAMTAYSAVSAVKALKDGNIMGAIAGGFGAYMGLSSTGAFGTQVAGDATSLSAEVGGQSFAEASGAGFLDSAGMTSSVFDGAVTGGIGDVVGSVGDTAIGGLVTGSGAAISPEVGQVSNLASKSEGGFLSNLGDSIGEGWDSVLETGKGVVDSVGDLVSTEDGSLLAKAGEAVGGKQNLFNMAKMGAGYLLDKKKQDDQLEFLEDQEARKRADLEATRARKGAAPTYVYDFGRSSRQAAGA